MANHYISIPIIDNLDIPMDVIRKCKDHYVKYGKYGLYDVLNESLDTYPFQKDIHVLQEKYDSMSDGEEKTRLKTVIDNEWNNIEKRKKYQSINLTKRYLYLYRIAMIQTLSAAYNTDEFEVIDKSAEYTSGMEYCPYCGEKYVVLDQLGGRKVQPVSYYDDVLEYIHKDITYKKLTVTEKVGISIYEFIQKLTPKSFSGYIFQYWSPSKTGDIKLTKDNIESAFEYCDKDGNVNLYACYISSTEGNSQIYAIEEVSYISVEDILSKQTERTKVKYDFGGWYIKDHESLDNAYFLKESDNTVKASYDFTGTTKETVTFGKTLRECIDDGELIKPSKEHYLFDTFLLSEYDEELSKEDLDKDIDEFIVNNGISFCVRYVYDVAEGTFSYDDKAYRCLNGHVRGISHFSEICPECRTLVSYRGYAVPGGANDLSRGLKVLQYTNGEWIPYTEKGIEKYIRDIASMNSLETYNSMINIADKTICYDDSVYADESKKSLRLWMYFKDEDPNYDKSLADKFKDYREPQEGLYRYHWIYVPENEVVLSCVQSDKKDYTVTNAVKCYSLNDGREKRIATNIEKDEENVAITRLNFNRYKGKWICRDNLDRDVYSATGREIYDYEEHVCSEEYFTVKDLKFDTNEGKLVWSSWVLPSDVEMSKDSEITSPASFTGFRRVLNDGSIVTITQDYLVQQGFISGDTYTDKKETWKLLPPEDESSVWDIRESNLSITLFEIAYKFGANPIVQSAIEHDNVRYYNKFTVILIAPSLDKYNEYEDTPVQVTLQTSYNLKYAVTGTNPGNILLPEIEKYESQDTVTVGATTKTIYGGFALDDIKAFTDTTQTIQITPASCQTYYGRYRITDIQVTDEISIKRPVLVNQEYLMTIGFLNSDGSINYDKSNETWTLTSGVSQSYGINDGNGNVFPEITSNAIEQVGEYSKTVRALKSISISGVIVSGGIEGIQNSISISGNNTFTKKTMVVNGSEVEVDVPDHQIINSEGIRVNDPTDAANYDPSYTGLNYAGWKWIATLNEKFDGVEEGEAGIIEAYPIKEKDKYVSEFYPRNIFISEFNSSRYADSTGNIRTLIKYCKNISCYVYKRILQKQKWNFLGSGFSSNAGGIFLKAGSNVKGSLNYQPDVSQLSLDEYMFPWETNEEERTKVYDGESKIVALPLRKKTGEDYMIKLYRYYLSKWSNLADKDYADFKRHVKTLHRGGRTIDKDPFRFEFEYKYATNEWSATKYNPPLNDDQAKDSDIDWEKRKGKILRDNLKVINWQVNTDGSSVVPMTDRPIKEFQDDYKKVLLDIFGRVYTKMCQRNPYTFFKQEVYDIMNGILKDLDYSFKLEIINFILLWNEYEYYRAKDWNSITIQGKAYEENKALVKARLSSISGSNTDEVIKEYLESKSDLEVKEIIKSVIGDNGTYEYNRWWYYGKNECEEFLKEELSSIHERLCLPFLFVSYLICIFVCEKNITAYYDDNGAVGSTFNSAGIKSISTQSDYQTIAREKDGFNPSLTILSRPFPNILDDNRGTAVLEQYFIQFTKSGYDGRVFSFMNNGWLDLVFNGTEVYNYCSLLRTSQNPILNDGSVHEVVGGFSYENPNDYQSRDVLDEYGKTIGSKVVYCGYSNICIIYDDCLLRHNIYTKEYIDTKDSSIKAINLFTSQGQKIHDYIFDKKNNIIILLSDEGEIASVNVITNEYVTSKGVYSANSSKETRPTIHYVSGDDVLSGDYSLDNYNFTPKNIRLRTALVEEDEYKDAIAIQKVADLEPTTLEEGEAYWVLNDGESVTGATPKEISQSWYESLVDSDKDKYKPNEKLLVKYAIANTGITESNIQKTIEIDYVKYNFRNFSLEANSGVSIMPTQENDILSKKKSLYAVYVKDGVTLPDNYGYKSYITENIVNGIDQVVGKYFKDYLDENSGNEEGFSSRYTGVSTDNTIMNRITNLFNIDGYFENGEYIQCFVLVNNDEGSFQIIELHNGKMRVVLTMDYSDSSPIVGVRYITGKRSIYIIYENQRIVNLTTFQYIPHIYQEESKTEKISVLADNFDNYEGVITYWTDKNLIHNISTDIASSKTYKGTSFVYENPLDFVSSDGKIVGIKEMMIKQIDFNTFKSASYMRGDDSRSLIETN